jgi:hypothetical protein
VRWSLSVLCAAHNVIICLIRLRMHEGRLRWLLLGYVWAICGVGRLW